MTAFAAVDLGASSGRVMVGRVTPDTVELTEAHRITNTPVRIGSTLHWDILGLYRGVLDGLRRAGDITSIGIDSWAVDYGLLDSAGALIGNPVHYRDARTERVFDSIVDSIGADKLYDTTGLQLLSLNTLYQLAASADSPQLSIADTLLMIPDLLAYWLTGEKGAELTNASTTQFFNVRTRTWAPELLAEVGVDPRILPPLREPGTTIGPASEFGGVPVVAVGSHDTASAVVGVPASGDRFAYISCGTWALVGLELPKPVLTEESRLANFTNEAGVDGTIRYLRNVMGLWLLQEFASQDIGELLAAASRVPAFRTVIDPDHASLFAPSGGGVPSMATRIAALAASVEQPVPSSPAEFARCIVDSLALAFRRTVAQACALSGRDVDAVHIVGGGAQNALLCQLTADACGVPVLAGPVEATALGNVLVQARAAGDVGGSLANMRDLLARTQHVVRYEPQGTQSAWSAAAARLGW